MTENLALGSTTQSYTLTSIDTNLAENETFILPVASAYDSSDWDRGTETDPKAAVRVTNNQENPSWGNSYDWYAAVAGHYTYTDFEYIYYSICPKGWLLPRTGNNDTDIAASFQYLIDRAYDLPAGFPATITQDQLLIYLDTPFNIDLAGEVESNGDWSSVGTTGSYWLNQRRTYEADVLDQSKRFYITTNNMSINTSGNRNVRVGNAIRCVASKTK